jgi:micrococcal nuclease
MGKIATRLAFGTALALGAAFGLSWPMDGTKGVAVPSRSFTICHTGGGVNCVVDGDTAWIDGEKVRIADIDAPETHPPRCASEAELGSKATRRLAELLNAGGFEMSSADRDADRYGRKLRILVRDGRSLGDQLVSEGLARPWGGHRQPWC